MNALDLFEKYLALSKRILELNILKNYDEFQDIISQREEILSKISDVKVDSKELKELGDEIMKIDSMISKKIVDEKEMIAEEILDIKREKSKSTKKRQVLKTYASRDRNQDSYYFDKKK